MKNRVEPTPETSCILNVAQTMNKFQHNTGTRKFFVVVLVPPFKFL